MMKSWVLFVLFALIPVRVLILEITQAPQPWESGRRLTSQEINETLAHLERYGYKADRAKSLHKNERLRSLLKDSAVFGGGEDVVIVYNDPRSIGFIDPFRITHIGKLCDDFVRDLGHHFRGDKKSKNEWTPAGSKRPVEGSISPGSPEQEWPAHAIYRTFAQVRGGGGGH